MAFTGGGGGNPAAASATGLRFSFSSSSAAAAAPAPSIAGAFGTTSTLQAPPPFSFGTPTGGASVSTITTRPAPTAPTSFTTQALPGASAQPPSFAVPAAQLPAATTTTTQSGASDVPQMNFRQLQESINKWMIDLQEQEKNFMEQITKVNAWDRTLIANGEKISRLNDYLNQVKVDHTRLEHAIDYLKTQQKEIGAFLEPLEANLPVNIPVEPEREQLYQMSGQINSELENVATDLKFVIEKINECNVLAIPENKPLVQMMKIMNEHTDALLWIERKCNEMKEALPTIRQQHSDIANIQKGAAFIPGGHEED